MKNLENKEFYLEKITELVEKIENPKKGELLYRIVSITRPFQILCKLKN